MKSLFLISLLLYQAVVFAQSFEGIIKWSIKADLPSDAQNSLQDSGPQMQQALQEMEKKMNDPEFKKQMEANPEMKTIMEQQMAKMRSMQQASASGEGLMPTSITIEIKDGNTLTKMDGAVGAMMGDILYLKEKDKSYSINRQSKTYSSLPSSKTPENHPKPKVTKTSETLNILNYTCHKYIVEQTEPKSGKTLTYNVWTTSEIKDIDPKIMEKVNERRKGFSMEGVEGFPMKIETQNPEMSMTMQVTELKKQPLPASDFTIPTDYKESKF